MAEPVVEETPAPDTYPCFSSEFAILTPPFDNIYNSSSDQALLGNSISDMRFLIDGDGDFELTVGNDLYFPTENETFVIPVDATNREMSGDFTPVLGISGDRANEDADQDTNGVLISTSSCRNQESPRDSDFSGAAQSLSLSTQDSANCVSDILEATNASSSLGSGKLVEEEATTYKKTSITKRKNKIEEDTSDKSRNSKYMRSDQDGFASVVTGGEEDDEKRNVRLIRNRESAHLSRQRKKHYVKELEDKVKNMYSTISELNCKMSYFVAENATLRQQVGPGSGMWWPRHPPLAPMAYPWLPCPSYMVKPQGSQVPLLPIPRLKPQQSLAKVKKTKKSRVSRRRVLDVNGHLDVSVKSNRVHCGRVSDQGVGRNRAATENSVPPQTSSEPLVASLFVPRNEKLVKIDGNLIIHSVLASEKAMVSETKNGEGKTGVATTTKGVSPALPLPDSARTRDVSKHLYSEMRKVLSSSGSDDASKEQLQSTTANDEMQQWFRDGVAGPMFSSGMCTEVFQFDVSSNSGVLVPASPPTQQSTNTTNKHKRKQNRRILRGGLPVSDFNLTKDLNSSSKENFQDTKLAPSMVVSVLADPRDGGDGDIDGMMRAAKSLSRVFIVVLVDGVKYVTYSCVLPRPEVPHLVTT